MSEEKDEPGLHLAGTDNVDPASPLAALLAATTAADATAALSQLTANLADRAVAVDKGALLAACKRARAALGVEWGRGVSQAVGQCLRAVGEASASISASAQETAAVESAMAASEALWVDLPVSERHERALEFGTACKDGNLDEAKRLFALGIDLASMSTIKDARGDEWTDTPLGWAADSASTTVVEYLLRHGAVPNQMAAYGSAPIHVAAQKGDLVIVQMLVAYGADPTLKSIDGKTPQDWTQGGIHSLYDGGEEAREATRRWLDERTA